MAGDNPAASADSNTPLTVAQVQKLLNCSHTTVYDLYNSGELEGFRLKKRGGIRIHRKSVDEFVSRNSNTAKPKVEPPALQPAPPPEKKVRKRKPRPGEFQWCIKPPAEWDEATKARGCPSDGPARVEKDLEHLSKRRDRAVAPANDVLSPEELADLNLVKAVLLAAEHAKQFSREVHIVCRYSSLNYRMVDYPPSGKGFRKCYRVTAEGEILPYAGYPPFDPNAIREEASRTSPEHQQPAQYARLSRLIQSVLGSGTPARTGAS